MWALKLGWSTLRRQWLQTVMLIIGLSLGTAVVVAVDLANQSARRSFELSSETLTGRTTHQIISPAGTPVPESLYLRLRQESDIQSAPVISANVSVSSWRRSVKLLGIDPLAEAPFRSHLGASNSASSTAGTPDLGEYSALITRTDAVLLTESLGKELPKDHYLNINEQRVEVIGLLKNPDPVLSASLGDVILADIGTAQQLLRQKGGLTRIDLILPPGREASLKTLLPPGLEIVSARTRNEGLQQMSAAFSLNLSALSLLALVVGMFLAYNTVSFSVLRRRAQLGTLRTLGVTQGGIFALILGETLIISLLAAGLGLLLGIVLGQGMLRLVTQTINDLYYTLEVTRLEISPYSLLKGVAGALTAALLATLLPAWEATQTPPAGVLRASSLEEALSPRVGRIALAGLALMLIGGSLLTLPGALWFSFACFLGVVAGAALCIPWLARGFMLALSQRLGPVARMAPRQLARSLSRSAVAMAALMVAVSVVISVSVMIGSFRGTVIDWLDRTLSADFFVTAPGGPGSASLNPELQARLARVPGVARVESSRQRQLFVAGKPLNLLSLSRDIASQRRFVWLEGDRDSLWDRLEQGAVLVSQPYATRHGITPNAGQRVTLPTRTGSRDFPIIGIYYDYASDQGVVLLPRKLYQQYWDDPAFSALAVFVTPQIQSSEQLTQVKQALNQALAGPYSLQSHRELKAGAMTVFERTFAITGALRLLAIAVAFMGIFSTLMSLLLERQRSFGILRSLGLTPNQIGGLVLFESGLMGLFSGIMALPLGVILALFLIYVINLRSFGWTMDLLLTPDLFIQGLFLALGAALLGGIWPAWRVATRLVARSVRE